MKSAQTFDCTKCGACCVSEHDLDAYVDTEPSEAELIPAHMLLRRFGFSSLRTKKRPRGDVVCIALRGQLGKKVRCSIYDVRPAVCRSFRPGSRACLLSRAEVGIAKDRR